MGYYSTSHIKVAFLLLMAMIFTMVSVVWYQYPFGVKSYKTIQLGMRAAEKAGDALIWAPPYRKVPEESTFFVYSLGDETMCIRSSCGMGGHFIECLGGWISGYHISGDTFDYGLDEQLINSGKEKVITIANKEGKIVGIYPGARIRNLPYIMRHHRDLVPNDLWTACSDQLPRRWK